MDLSIQTKLGLELFSDEIKETFVIHIPHSSTYIPDDEIASFYSDKLRVNMEQLTDWKTDVIFDVPKITKMFTPFSRLFCDVERFDDNEEPMFKYGRGFYYTHGFDGTLIREVDEERKSRIYNEYYMRHHELLEYEVSNKIEKNGVCTIFDCHSFNEEPISPNVSDPMSPDICIGADEYHTPKYLLDYTVNYWSNLGYTVSVNNPYSGCIIPKNFYRNNPNVQGIMIEINKRLYMNGLSIIDESIKTLNNQMIGYFNL